MLQTHVLTTAPTVCSLVRNYQFSTCPVIPWKSQPTATDDPGTLVNSWSGSLATRHVLLCSLSCKLDPLYISPCKVSCIISPTFIHLQNLVSLFVSSNLPRVSNQLSASVHISSPELCTHQLSAMPVLITSYRLYLFVI